MDVPSLSQPSIPSAMRCLLYTTPVLCLTRITCFLSVTGWRTLRVCCKHTVCWINEALELQRKSTQLARARDARLEKQANKRQRTAPARAALREKVYQDKTKTLVDVLEENKDLRKRAVFNHNGEVKKNNLKQLIDNVTENMKQLSLVLTESSNVVKMPPRFCRAFDLNELCANGSKR